jgi:prolyl-tRNA editing enzyme YbaK/EbsC (Cys-tRNA(Pro) deacylase)
MTTETDRDADREALERALAGHGEYELFACDPALADTVAFCAAYGFALEDSANTIVVVGKGNPPVYAACVVLATHRLDVNRVIKGRFGRKSSFASPEETRDLTGMAIGGVTAFGLPADLPLWVDAAVMERPRIVLGGGSRSWKVIAPPTILLTLPNVEVVEGLANVAPPRPPAEA